MALSTEVLNIVMATSKFAAIQSFLLLPFSLKKKSHLGPVLFDSHFPNQGDWEGLRGIKSPTSPQPPPIPFNPFHFESNRTRPKVFHLWWQGHRHSPLFFFSSFFSFSLTLLYFQALTHICITSFELTVYSLADLHLQYIVSIHFCSYPILYFYFLFQPFVQEEMNVSIVCMMAAPSPTRFFLLWCDVQLSQSLLTAKLTGFV